MKLKHTPGPWEKDYGSTEGHIKSIGIPEYNYTPTVCRYKNLYKGDFTVADSLSIEEQEANGRLIAFAPKMLEALIEDCKKSYNVDMNNPMFQGNPPIKHKELIEKVTGLSIKEVIE